LSIVPCLTLSLSFSTLTLATPIGSLERRMPFTLYDPNGGDRLFSDDGRVRTITEQTDWSVDDIAYTAESVGDHSDMVELVHKYAPVFKLSYVPSIRCP